MYVHSILSSRIVQILKHLHNFVTCTLQYTTCRCLSVQYTSTLAPHTRTACTNPPRPRTVRTRTRTVRPRPRTVRTHERMTSACPQLHKELYKLVQGARPEDAAVRRLRPVSLQPVRSPAVERRRRPETVIVHESINPLVRLHSCRLRRRLGSVALTPFSCVVELLVLSLRLINGCVIVDF